jgi:hypothetical protein
VRLGQEVQALPRAGLTGIAYKSTYSYDQLNRMSGASWDNVAALSPPPASAVAFTHGYNKANQRTSQTTTDNSYWAYPAGPASATAYTVNELNQYTQVGAQALGYDGNGNLYAAFRWRRMMPMISEAACGMLVPGP